MNGKFWKKCLIGVGVIALYIVLVCLGFRCVFQTFLHIPCPGCGMTRAIGSLLACDWRGAFFYHPAVYIMPFAAAFLFQEGKLFRRKSWNVASAVFIIAVFVGCYLARFLGFLERV